MTNLVLREGFRMGVISNSETSSFQTCQRKHFYAFGHRLQPRRMSQGLTRGIVGHEILAIYYSALAEGSDFDTARNRANDHMAGIMGRAQGEEVLLLTELQQRLMDYYEWSRKHELDKFRFVEVEQEYRLDMPGGVTYAMRLDLLAEALVGPYVGQLVLIDHKFVYDFYSEDEVAMNAQLPKYLGILQANGRDVRVAFLNQIRTRVNKKKPMAETDKFRRAVVKPYPAETRQIFAEELKVAHQITLLRSLPVDLWEKEVTRSMTPMNCKVCAFAVLCKADLQGQDTTLMRQVEFEPTTYGYQEVKS